MVFPAAADSRYPASATRQHPWKAWLQRARVRPQCGGDAIPLLWHAALPIVLSCSPVALLPVAGSEYVELPAGGGPREAQRGAALEQILRNRPARLGLKLFPNAASRHQSLQGGNRGSYESNAYQVVRWDYCAWPACYNMVAGRGAPPGAIAVALVNRTSAAHSQCEFQLCTALLLRQRRQPPLRHILLQHSLHGVNDRLRLRLHLNVDL